MKRGIVVVALLIWSWFWFLPIAGFDHMFRCGVLGWAILDNEGDAVEMRWSALVLMISVGGWLGGISLGLLLRRCFSSAAREGHARQELSVEPDHVASGPR